MAKKTKQNKKTDTASQAPLDQAPHYIQQLKNELLVYGSTSNGDVKDVKYMKCSAHTLNRNVRTRTASTVRRGEPGHFQQTHQKHTLHFFHLFPAFSSFRHQENSLDKY